MKLIAAIYALCWMWGEGFEPERTIRRRMELSLAGWPVRWYQ